MAARIPVFVSAPSALSADQQASYDFIVGLLASEHFEHRALGRTDYGVDFPLKEVFSIARHCSGGVILGFEQMRAARVESKPGTASSKTLRNVSFPTPWNNLEAGILFGLRLPLLVFRQKGIHGGVFDNGVSDVFIQALPDSAPDPDTAIQIGIVVKHWAGKVRENYRSY
ncbi:hypothetical protein [Mycobacterium sp. 236(2023)]|uniref:hypothetical protein n=1 Tax=Mycobacterium sp. 236(2023) TaxID=3038163 RepID=UPI0024152D2D|nr:hypothetical protein [Mycobacterium sp. 236(2023)]MDG4666064.1 hypothetical protein [Mycobacterium sp. 236(2023)]